MTRRWGALAVAACVCAWGCGGEGTGGDPPADRVLAPGELAEPVSIETSWLSLQVRSAVLQQGWEAPGLPGYYSLRLLEGTGGCVALGETALGAGWSELDLYAPGLLDGTCRPDVACEGSVDLRPAPGAGLPVYAVWGAPASLTLARPFDGFRLAGELRVSFARDLEFEVRAEYDADGGGSMLCVSAAGRFRRCALSGDVSDCCNEGKPLEEWVIPFDAAFCPEAVACTPGSDCVAATAAACPITGEPVDCATACAHAVALCRLAYRCEAGDWVCERSCDPLVDTCPPTCVATAAFPVFGTAFSCLESHDTPDGWTSCMTTCGDTP